MARVVVLVTKVKDVAIVVVAMAMVVVVVVSFCTLAACNQRLAATVVKIGLICQSIRSQLFVTLNNSRTGSMTICPLRA